MRIDLTRAQIIDLNPRDFTFTSASLDLFEACPASAVFNGPKKGRPINAGMWYGIFVHRFLEYATNKGHDFALAYIRGKAQTGRSAKNALSCCEKINLEALPLGEAEVAMAHDLEAGTARRLYGPHDRARSGEAFGKADLVFHEGDVPHVADYKCGWLNGDPNNHPQLLGLACSVRLETKSEEVRVSLVGVASNGELHWNTISADKPRMDWFEDRMKRVHLRVQNDRVAFREVGTVPEFRPGEHCNRCHCQSIPCPALPAPQAV